MLKYNVAKAFGEVIFRDTMAQIKAIGNNSRLDRILNRDHLSVMTKGYVEVGEEKFCLSDEYKNNEHVIRNFEVRDNDVYLAAFPKTGTTWSSEMMWLIVNNLNYEGAKEVLQTRVPLLEFSAIVAPEFDNAFENGCMAFIQGLEGPRCIKTHLPFPLLPEQIRNGTKKPKFITVLRNSHDTCISQYHFEKATHQYIGSFDDFCELFLCGRVRYGPFWEHILSYWNQRHNQDILFIKYKDMKADLPSVIRQVAKFLNKTISDDDAQKLGEHLSFENMQKNPAVNFKHVVNRYTKHDPALIPDIMMRAGKEGAYKTAMSPELIERFEKWTKEKFLGSGIEL